MRGLGRYIVMFIFGFTVFVQAQYFDERVIEKSFEKSDFFFQPVYLNPYQIGQFGNALPGLVDDLLLNLKVNPAYLANRMTDKQYVYVDFRNSRDQNSSNSYDPTWKYGYLDYAPMPFPIYYVDSRKELEPVISLAYFIRPTGKTSPLVLGMTYQLLMQDESYYQVPYDVYKSNVGLDYAGRALSEDSSIPITDRYSGDDLMEQDGHFLAVTAGLTLSPKFYTGLRIGRAVFDRDGAYGNTNVWEDNYLTESQNNNSSMTDRVQDYNHWNTTLGFQYQASDDFLLGVKAGYLKGLANQTQLSESGSLYRDGVIDQGENWSYYYQSALNDQEWEHDGGTIYAGLHIESKMENNSIFFTQYTWQKEDVDLTSSGLVADTSYSNYYYVGDSWRSRSISHSAVDDIRSGSGNRSGNRYDFTAGMRLVLDSKTKLGFGIHVEKHDVTTETLEHVTARRVSEYTHSNSENWSMSDYYRYNSVGEKKDLNWDLKIQSVRVQIPIVLTHMFSKHFEVMFGINRSIDSWEIEEQTLAVFAYRDKQVNGEREYKENFGERYTEPREKQNDVKTGILGGITVHPSEQFSLKLLMAPHYMKTYQGTELKEFQWWISMALHLNSKNTH